MSTADKLPSSLIPFESSFQFGGVILITVLVLTGTIVQIIIILATFKGKHITTGTKFLLSLCFADLLFCITQSVFSIWNLSLGGWASGPIGCIMDASLTIIAEGSSLLSLAAVTLDRYLIVISRKPMSHRTCHLIILGIWVGLSNMVCFVFFYNFEAAGLGHSMLLCVIAWWGKSPWTIFAITVALTVLFSVLIYVIYAYLAIILFYRETKGKARTTSNHSATEADKKLGPNTKVNIRSSVASRHGISQEEYHLLLRSLSITGTYFICWFPYMIRIVVEVVRSVPSPDYIEVICDFFVVLYPVLTAFFMFYFDKEAKGSVMKVLGITQKSKTIARPTKYSIKKMVLANNELELKDGDE